MVSVVSMFFVVSVVSQFFDFFVVFVVFVGFVVFVVSVGSLGSLASKVRRFQLKFKSKYYLLRKNTQSYVLNTKSHVKISRCTLLYLE